MGRSSASSSKARAWPAEQVERWALDRIREAARNPRTHSDAQVEALAASLREFGWTIPLLVDDAGVLIAGHGRLRAARLLGLADAPVMVARGWTEAQTRAYRVADNQLALAAGWDEELLAAELAEIKSVDFDLSLIGFNDEDLARLLDTITDDPAENHDERHDRDIVYREQYGVIVICDDVSAQEQTYNRLMQLGYHCKVVCT